MPTKDIAKEVIILLGVALTVAFAVNLFSPKGIAVIGDWDTSEGVVSARPKDNVVVHDLEIDDVAVAKQIYDQGNVLFIDARSEDFFEAGHIKGAVSMPVDQFETHIEALKKMYPFSKFIVTYCSGRECDDSHKLAQKLFEAGYSDISVFIDGYPGWEAAGYPVGSVVKSSKE